ELAFGLDISKPPLLRAALIEEQSKQYIMLVIHHLVIDPLSWSELLRECEEAYACWRNGQSVSFRLSAVGFTQYTARLAETALSDKTKLASEAEYWKGELGIRDMSVPVDQEGEKNTEKSTAVHTVWLTEDESKCALRLSPSRLQCTAEDVLLGAFGRSLAEWGGRDTWVVNLERNGRDMADAEWSRAVGCFSAFIPFVLTTRHGSLMEDIAGVNLRRRRLPGDPASFGILRYLCEGAEGRELRTIPLPQISFNYLGHVDPLLGRSELFGRNPGILLPPLSAKAERPFVLQVESAVIRGRLQIRMIYSRNLHDSTTIAALADDYAGQLRSLTKVFAGSSEIDNDTLPPTSFRHVDIFHNRQPVDSYSLTPLQEGLLFLNRLSPNTSSYVVQMSALIEGSLDLREFKSAWDQIVAS